MLPFHPMSRFRTAVERSARDRRKGGAALAASGMPLLCDTCRRPIRCEKCDEQMFLHRVGRKLTVGCPPCKLVFFGKSAADVVCIPCDKKAERSAAQDAPPPAGE